MYVKDEHNITCKYTRFQTIGKSTLILQQLKYQDGFRMEKYQNVFVGRAFSMSDNKSYILYQILLNVLAHKGCLKKL